MQTNDWEGGAPTDLADRDDANPELERALESFRQEQERWERQLRLSAERIDQAEAEVFKLRKSLERVRETMSYRLGYSHENNAHRRIACSSRDLRSGAGGNIARLRNKASSRLGKSQDAISCD